MADVPSLVARLARNQMLLVRPSQIPDTVAPQCSDQVMALLPQIHRHIIGSCISNSFPSLLYTYCDFWRYVPFLLCNSCVLFCSFYTYAWSLIQNSLPGKHGYLFVQIIYICCKFQTLSGED